MNLMQNMKMLAGHLIGGRFQKYLQTQYKKNYDDINVMGNLISRLNKNYLTQ